MKRSNDVVTSRRSAGRIADWAKVSFLLAVFISFFGIGDASAAVNKSFDHLQTGFPLTGAHKRVECESCHIQGVFRGTPRQCKGCHAASGLVKASSKPVDHVPSSDDCADCHKASTWSFARFNHVGVTAACVTCHNGRTAPGKSRDHPQTSDDCASCHQSRSWAGARYDHSGIVDGCERCHLKNLPQNHPLTNHTCHSCHRYPSWSNLRMDHNAIAGARCASCHDGRIAEGKPRNHVQTASDCMTCHKTNTWLGATVDHSLISSGCSNCHLNDRTASHPLTATTCETGSASWRGSELLTVHAAAGSA
ncbi:MAG: hypothetical protein GC138_10005, partial [Gammaproteobacteria bacterium]|nr:hypothetical protein [Gammaproteobacteria bacterium]